MVFTLIAYSESQDSSTLTNVAALVDPHVRVVGDDIIVHLLQTQPKRQTTRRGVQQKHEVSRASATRPS